MATCRSCAFSLRRLQPSSADYRVAISPEQELAPAIATLSRLRSLSLISCHRVIPHAAALVHALQQLTALTSLVLLDVLNEPARDDPELYQAFPHLQQLESLAMIDSVVALENQHISLLTHLTALTYLDVSQMHLHFEAKLQVCQSVAALTQLRGLRLLDMDLEHAHAHVLATVALPALPSLQQLVLASSYALRGEGVAALVHAAPSSLTSLDLARSFVSSKAPAVAKALSCMRSLRAVKLVFHDEMESADAEALMSQLAQMPALEELDILLEVPGNGAHQKTFPRLAQCTGLTSLAWRCLSPGEDKCQAVKVMARHLPAIQRLKHLGLSRGEFGSGGMPQFLCCCAALLDRVDKPIIGVGAGR
jgi:hypothetical protein